jgi:putative acyl-CoA dehydrogenase
MTPNASPGGYSTHTVENQPPELRDYNVFESDPVLAEALMREGGGWGRDRAMALGARVGSAEVLDWARQANRQVPELLSHDRFGNRRDEVVYHPAWHDLMRLGVSHAVHALPWREPKQGAHAVRAALAYLLNQGENGVCCPIAMTFAAVSALRAEPAVAAEWEPRLVSTEYDGRFVPVAEKAGCIFGMAITEKQGGSDVQANASVARPAGSGSTDEFLLAGHKWFCSAPMSDGILTLARTPAGLTCFLVPRWLPDGTANRFLIQRLKDKLGNRANASAEIEYADTWARRVGPEGEGVRTIVPMIHHTRLDAAISAAAVMRQAVVQALHHTAHRNAFGARLADQPLMRNVLADLALESEAATVMVMRLARGFDEAALDDASGAFTRLATAMTKYWVCKRAPTVVAEAMECLGGNGYVEDALLPRLYREAPVNGIWEGTGNVICLDILRTMAREPAAVPALFDAMKPAKGGNRHLDRQTRALQKALAAPPDDPAQARRIVEDMALAWQASLLVCHAPAPIADAFCATRLGGEGGRTLGTLPDAADTEAIVKRAWQPD